MVKPGGTGMPARVISAAPAPLPPRRSRICAEPSRNRYTHLCLPRAAGIAHSVPPAGSGLGDGLLGFELGELLDAQVVEAGSFVQPAQRAGRPPVEVAE